MRAIVCAFFAALTPMGAAAADVRLLPGVPIFVSGEEPESVQRAVKDLRRDLEAVLGGDSPLVHRIEAVQGKPAIVIARPAAGLGEISHPSIKGREAHGVFVRGEHVMLQGADARGTIYAIYTFSERFLGIPRAGSGRRGNLRGRTRWSSPPAPRCASGPPACAGARGFRTTPIS